MADTAAAIAARFATATRRSGGALRLAELPRLAQFTLRLDPKSRAADTAAVALGIPLPMRPNTAVHGSGTSALWLGPDEWLVVGRPDTRTRLASRLRAATTGEPAAVVDVSAQRTTLLIAGPLSRDLLSHGCSLDLHPRAFGAGRCAQTLLARAQVVLVGRGETRPGFWVLVRSSYAGYLADWLLDAASEYVESAARAV